MAHSTQSFAMIVQVPRRTTHYINSDTMQISVASAPDELIVSVLQGTFTVEQLRVHHATRGPKTINAMLNVLSMDWHHCFEDLPQGPNMLNARGHRAILTLMRYMASGVNPVERILRQLVASCLEGVISGQV